MQSEQQKLLWNRIHQFAIDDPLASVKYSDKLAHHNAWSKEYTGRVIDEYKKFIFLCCILPGGASPSKPIDEAWHLHLTYTHNYWKEFCNQVLEKEIHHFPSKGGPDEKEKHVQWYDRTLNAYRQVFGEDPPKDIWISESRIETKITIANKTLSDYKEWYKRYIYIFILPFLLSLVLYGKFIPYQLTGPQFLVFYGSLIVTAATYLLLIRYKKIREARELMSDTYKGDANIYQVSRFVFGRENSLRAAIVDLVSRNVLEPAKKNKFIYHSVNYRYSPSEQNPLALGLIKNVKDAEEIPFTSLSGYYDEEATYHIGLSELYKSMSRKDYLPLIFGGIVVIVGIARIIQGVHHEKPVAYLGLMVALSFLFTLIVASISSGQKIMQQLFEAEFNNTSRTQYQPAGWAAMFVFLGLGSLSLMSGYSQLHNTFSRNKDAGDSGSWGGGCGSDGGGGCGGGGCGGCGGGD